jgi:hypothetical protein
LWNFFSVYISAHEISGASTFASPFATATQIFCELFHAYERYSVLG